MSDMFWIPIIGVIGTISTTIITAVMTYFIAKLNKKQDDAAVKVEEVAVKQDKASAKVDEVATNAANAAIKVEEVKQVLGNHQLEDEKRMTTLLQVANDTHTLVNSNMGVQLKISAIALRRIADLRPEDAADQAAAELAEKSYVSHQEKQKLVDDG